MATKKKPTPTAAEVTEEVLNTVEPVVEAPKPVATTSKTVVSEKTVKVGLFGYVTIDLEDGATELTVESLSGGEVFVSNELLGFTDKEVVKVGGKMGFDMPVVLTADTVVRVKVTQYK